MSFFKEKLEIFKNNFKKFWRKTSKSNLPKELIEITEKFIISDSFRNVSNYWHIINIKNSIFTSNFILLCYKVKN